MNAERSTLEGMIGAAMRDLAKSEGHKGKAPSSQVAKAQTLHLDRARKCAERNMTMREAADVMGLSLSSIKRFAQIGNLRFRRPGDAR